MADTPKVTGPAELDEVWDDRLQGELDQIIVGLEQRFIKMEPKTEEPSIIIRYKPCPKIRMRINKMYKNVGWDRVEFKIKSAPIHSFPQVHAVFIRRTTVEAVEPVSMGPYK